MGIRISHYVHLCTKRNHLKNWDMEYNTVSIWVMVTNVVVVSQLISMLECNRTSNEYCMGYSTHITTSRVRSVPYCEVY